MTGNNGDQEWVARFLYGKRDELLRFAARRPCGLPGYSAEDIFQDCVMALSSASYASTVARLPSQAIMKSARTTIVRLVIRKRHAARREALLQRYAMAKAQLEMDRQGADAKLRHLMEYVESHLDPEQQNLLDMLFYKGMSIRSVSRLTGRSRHALREEVTELLLELRGLLTQEQE